MHQTQLLGLEIKTFGISSKKDFFGTRPRPFIHLHVPISHIVVSKISQQNECVGKYQPDPHKRKYCIICNRFISDHSFKYESYKAVAILVPRATIILTCGRDRELWPDPIF